MAAVQRLKKQGPLDVWAIRERLCLASSVMRSGDQNWVSVSRAIKPFGELSRLPDWFSQKNCALQYSDLLEKVEKPKRKRSSERGEIETPGDQIVRKLTLERIEELKRIIPNEQQQYRKLKQDLEMVKSGQLDNQLQEIWTKILEQEKAAMEAAAAEAVRLAHEAAARAQAQAAAKPFIRSPGSVGKPKKLPARHIRFGQSRRNSTQSEQSEQESAAESPDISFEVVEEESNQSDIGVPMSVTTSTVTSLAVSKPKTPPTSPLLTSLLKNQSQHSNTSTKIEVQDGMEETSPMSTSGNLSTNAITAINLNLPNQTEFGEAIMTQVNISEVLTPITPVKTFTSIQVLTSPSAGAPTLSKLLSDPPITNPKIKTPSPIVAPSTSPLFTTVVEPISTPLEPTEPMLCSEIDTPAQLSENSTLVSTVTSPAISTPFENVETIVTPMVEPSPALESETIKENVGEESTTEIKVEPIPEEPMEICESDSATEPIEAPSESPAGKETDQKEPALDMEVEEDKEKDYINGESTVSSIQAEIVPNPNTEEEIDQGVDIKMEEESPLNETESVKEAELTFPNCSESSKVSDESIEPFKKKVGNKINKDLTLSRNKSKILLDNEKSPDDTLSTAPPSPTTLSPHVTSTEAIITSSTISTTTNSIAKITDVTVAEPTTSVTEIVSPESITTTISEDNISKPISTSSEDITKSISEETSIPISINSENTTKPVLFTDSLLSPVTTDNATKSIGVSSPSCVHLDSVQIKEEPIQSEGPMSSDEEQTILDSDDMSNLEKSRSLSITDSIPNSPASVFRDEENQRDYKSWKKAIMLVWRAAANHKFANVFLHPVTDEVAPGYHSIVYRPMDLSTVKKNIETGVIRTTSEFQRDVMLMFQNAIMYNNSDHDVYHMAIEMQKEVIKIIQDFLATQLMLQTAETKVLRIREHSSRRSDSSEKRSASLPSEEYTASFESSKLSDKEEEKEYSKRKSTDPENTKCKKKRTRDEVSCKE